MIIRRAKSEEYDGVEVCNRVVSFEANELWERDTLEDGPEEDCCEKIEIYEIVVFSDDRRMIFYNVAEKSWDPHFTILIYIL